MAMRMVGGERSDVLVGRHGASAIGTADAPGADARAPGAAAPGAAARDAVPPGAAPEVEALLADLKSQLERHPVYAAIDSLASLRTFVQHHVACVFDFMSLLKSLQQDLAPARAPWLPPRDPAAARLINAIVLDEETDALPHRPGEHGSHFEWYLDGMAQLGADTTTTQRWLAAIREGMPPAMAMALAGAPPAAVAFVRTTMSALREPLAVRAAVFCHGREDVIPRMFAPLVARLAQQGNACDVFAGYLQRHIEVDGGEHGDHAHALVDRLCGGDDRLRLRGLLAAVEALRARLALWDAVLVAVQNDGAPR